MTIKGFIEYVCLIAGFVLFVYLLSFFEDDNMIIKQADHYHYAKMVCNDFWPNYKRLDIQCDKHAS